MPRWSRIEPIVIGGIAAGVVSTIAQVLLWLLFTDAFPEIIFRDARLAAAILGGARMLDRPPGFDLQVMLLASIVHFALSIAYAALFCPLVQRLSLAARTFAGALLGALLFAVNMYGFTALFPWFAATRDGITFAAHLVFGASCTTACSLASRKVRAAGLRSG